MTTKTNLITPTYNSIDWNVPLNANFGTINEAIGGSESVSVSAGNVTLSSTQAQKLRIIASGALTANRTIFLPAGCSGFWVVYNGTSGGYTLTVRNTAGAGGVEVIQGAFSIVTSDGVNTNFADDGGGVPPGTIIQFAGANPPIGYLFCDGSQFSRAGAPRLFAAIGTSWGAGDGSTTFNVPNLNGAFLRGSGAGLNPSPRAVGSYEADENKAHNHTATVNDPGHVHGLSSQIAAGGTTLSAGSGYQTANSVTVLNSTGITVSIANSGSESRPKNYAVLYCIKY